MTELQSHRQLQGAAQDHGLLPPSLNAALSRRTFLQGMAGTLLVGGHASTVLAAPPANAPVLDNNFWEKPRELWLKRSQTGDELRAVYWKDGTFLVEGYVGLCKLLRDVRADQAVQMDPLLLDVLAGMQGYYRAFGWNQPIYVTSGFRSVATNKALVSEGAALNSMHLYGKAADIHMPGIPVTHLGKVKQYLHDGGVGFYERRGFVHVDTGTLRSWRGR
jgi:uncharacterized protein YcbK (DUF882 family)